MQEWRRFFSSIQVLLISIPVSGFCCFACFLLMSLRSVDPATGSMTYCLDPGSDLHQKWWILHWKWWIFYWKWWILHWKRWIWIHSRRGDCLPRQGRSWLCNLKRHALRSGLRLAMVCVYVVSIDWFYRFRLIFDWFLTVLRLMFDWFLTVLRLISGDFRLIFDWFWAIFDWFSTDFRLILGDLNAGLCNGSLPSSTRPSQVRSRILHWKDEFSLGFHWKVRIFYWKKTIFYWKVRIL